MTRLPVLFVGHGSPMNAVEDNAFTRTWRELAQKLPRPKAVLCVSAHWQTQGVSVTAAERPDTIHDFRGFPPELSAVNYPAPGDPALARQVQALLPLARVKLDRAWGLDHGAWSVLTHFYPQADVPVVQLSLAFDQKPSFHYNLGRQLACLRDAGILVLGSGNIVHNLSLMNPAQKQASPWARRVNDAVKHEIESRDHRALLDFDKLDPDIRLAVPSDEHYLPLLYILGLQHADEPATFFNDRIVMGSIAMTGVAIGM
jgi:4,5-DOPA dioxygenase extradiol